MENVTFVSDKLSESFTEPILRNFLTGWKWTTITALIESYNYKLIQQESRVDECCLEIHVYLSCFTVLLFFQQIMLLCFCSLSRKSLLLWDLRFAYWWYWRLKCLRYYVTSFGKQIPMFQRIQYLFL